MVKSSAIKILTVKTTSENNYNYLNFLYYVLNSAKFENQGHARHYISIVQKQTAYIPTSRKELFFIQNIINKLDVLITLHQRYKDEQIFKELNYPYCITNAWEQRNASSLFISISDRGYPLLPILSATQDKGMIIRKETGLNIFHNKQNENSYKRVLPGQFVIHLRSFQGGFAHSNFEGITSPAYTVFDLKQKQFHSDIFWKIIFSSTRFIKQLELVTYGIRDGKSIKYDDFLQLILSFPNKEEQNKLAQIFILLNKALTLHQRKFLTKFSPKIITKGGIIMLSDISCNDFFYSFFEQWIKVYKEGAVRAVTMKKYYMTLSWVKKIAPTLKLSELTRITYQQLLNEYALSHERQTTMDFHHQLKGAIMDAVDDGLIAKDPTRKAIIKGKQPKEKKIKYLSQFELHNLLSVLDLKGDINWDWLILLVAKTGIRFSEALAITPADFDFSHQTLSISRTWDYKGNGGFLPTKNHSSVRKIQIDWQTVVQFSELVKNLPEDKPIFVKDKKIYNSTINTILARHCKEAKIPIIAIHGLRHTHASLLLFAGVSIASVARRLGHASMTTTQKTYLHIIQELENKDIDLVMRSISGLS